MKTKSTSKISSSGNKKKVNAPTKNINYVCTADKIIVRRNIVIDEAPQANETVNFSPQIKENTHKILESIN